MALTTVTRTSDSILTIRSSVAVVADLDPYPSTAPMRESVLLFPLPGRCVVSADLKLGRSNARLAAGSVSVYPSAFPKSARSATRRPVVSAGETLLDNRPRAVVQESGGRAHADVTETVRLWQAGGPFPSQNTAVAKGSPVALDVIWSSYGREVHARFAGPPVLRLGTRPGACSGASAPPQT